MLKIWNCHINYILNICYKKTAVRRSYSCFYYYFNNRLHLLVLDVHFFFHFLILSGNKLFTDAFKGFQRFVNF